MQVSDVMSRRAVSVSPRETAALAARLLARYGLGALPVVSGQDRILGIVTDRDIVVRCVAAGGDPDLVTVGEIMTPSVRTVSPDAAVEEALALMASAQVRRLPVATEGKLAGMVSLGDLARLRLDDAETAAALTEISGNVRLR